MLFLTATPQGDPVALIMVLCLLAVVALLTVRRYMSRRRGASEIAAPAEPATPPAPVPEAPGAAGQIKLHDVDPKIAAMAMAIVADKLGKPINTLRFISIKEIEKA